MTDLISIPFAGAVAVNGPGGANAHNLPNGGYQFNPGSGGGFNPATSLGASNSGTSNGLTQYIGFFQLVAYKSKKVVPVLLPGGGLSNTTNYEGQKMSGWRKYIVTCEPQQNTSIPQGPTGVFNPGQQDTHQIDTAGGLVTTHPATNTPRIPVVPGVVTTGQNNKAADIVRKRDEDARRKAIAAALAKRKAVVAALAKRKAIAAALAKRKAVVAALAKRKAIAAALVKRKAVVANKRRIRR
jgi:hypothetical protein